MPNNFDINNFKNLSGPETRYEKQLQRLKADKLDISCIEHAVQGSLKNLSENNCRRFVIYGEPQSGKTEMMICLTAKLLDEGYRFILHLLNDSVDLLNQNLTRFKNSGLAPSAKEFSEILDPAIDVSTGKFVVFCKKNSSNLTKLIDKVGGINDVAIIDDEADYASPNSKVNKEGERTKINLLIDKILGEDGVYIGVTATPARLDLNNTFDNDNNLWVHFPPHSVYTGQDIFFPIDSNPGFILTLLSDKGDEPKYARTALFSFLVNVAYLNNAGIEENYSMLVHTSGKTSDHANDWKIIETTLAKLNSSLDQKFETYVNEIWEIAKNRYADVDPNNLTKYIIENISRYSTIVLNSASAKKPIAGEATNPSSLFTIIIGGNIVSRGVTFNNLLSMFFTRDVKHKIQQDTYIQRARMFGSRGKYLSNFELTIPQNLYLDWHRCFVFHKLALAAIIEKLGSPVWLGDQRVSTVASSSIDKSTVDLNRGEMGFGLFDFNQKIDEIAENSDSGRAKIEQLNSLLGEGAFPDFLQKFIFRTTSPNSKEIAVHKSSKFSETAAGIDQERIERKKGFMGKTQLEKDKFPSAVHHLRVFRNSKGKARLIYKFEGSMHFIRNMSDDKSV